MKLRTPSYGQIVTSAQLSLTVGGSCLRLSEVGCRCINTLMCYDWLK